MTCPLFCKLACYDWTLFITMTMTMTVVQATGTNAATMMEMCTLRQKQRIIGHNRAYRYICRATFQIWSAIGRIRIRIMS